MLKETRDELSRKIREYKKNEGLTYEDDCPFPVSWKTIWSIISGPIEQNFTCSTQKKLLEFFGFEWERKGNDLIIKNLVDEKLNQLE